MQAWPGAYKGSSRDRFVLATLAFGIMATDSRYTLGAFAVIADSDGRVLLSHRRDLDLWNLPGGRLQLDELPDAAVVRQVKEETGLDVEVEQMIGVYGREDGRADLVFTFGCRVVGGRLAPSDEADRHEWFAADELPINTIPKHVARIEDAFSGGDCPVIRSLTEPSGREWLRILARDEGGPPSDADT